MGTLNECRGHAVVVQPDEGPSFWQPKPANGFTNPKLIPEVTNFSGFSMGYQNIAPRSHIRAHSHVEQVELQICFSGQGHVRVNGDRHELRPGTACFLGPDVIHELHNDHDDEDLVQLWVIGPAGLEDFFKAIGRPRAVGEPAPEPFDRPGDVVKIERSLGFDNTK